MLGAHLNSELLLHRKCTVVNNSFPDVTCCLKRNGVVILDINISLNEYNNESIKDNVRNIFLNNKDCAFLVENKSYDDMLLADQLVGYGCDVFVDDVLPYNDCANSTFLLCLDKAIKVHKDIFICQYDHKYDNVLDDLISMYDIQIKKKLYIVRESDKDESFYHLCSDNIDRVMTLSFEPVKYKRCKVLDTLFSIGFSISEHSIAFIQECTESKEWFLGHHYFVKDTLTEATLKYDRDESIGWKILSTNHCDATRIMILGGSTSSYQVYSVESWPEKLFNRLSEDGVDATLYIGARPGEGVVHECLRMIRDIYQIRPSIIISMSGVNDIAKWKCGQGFNLDGQYKKAKQNCSKKQCVGIQTKETLFEFWLRIEKLMKVIAEEYSSIFLSFLQPINIYMDNMSLREKVQFLKPDYYDGASEFYSKSACDDFYTNLIGLFHHKNDMFIDFCHYSEQANEMLADIVYKKILSSIRD